jgi:GNAT superfamily N-acetyltransferase
MDGSVDIRPARIGDVPFLREMLFEAFFWRPEVERPRFQDFMQSPEFKKLMSHWGRPGDRAVIAEASGHPIGAAWYRTWTQDEHSYGFVDEKTPEMGMGVRADERGFGLGRRLLRALIEQARLDDYEALSLSVEPDNFSRQLYSSEGFAKVGENGGAWTMVKKLNT